MHTLLCSSLLLGCAAFTAAAQRSASPRDAMVVNSAWLASHLKDPNLVLLHVGEDAEYQAKHLPGARFVRLNEIASPPSSPASLSLEMPSTADSLRQMLANLGVSDDSRVIVYYGNDWVSPSTRVMFTLAYAGLGNHVSLLDGGMQAWIKEGHAVTDVVPAVRVGKLSRLEINPVVVNADYVRAHIGKSGTTIVDARSGSLYDGVNTAGREPFKHRTGHIASAKSLPFDQPFTDFNFLKSDSEIAALFAKAGIAPGDTVVGYCHVGQQATAMLFAARLIGHPVLLYDGSFEDWSRRPLAEYPVDNPAAKPKP